MDIFSLLWRLERRALYDPRCLECLYHREWTFIDPKDQAMTTYEPIGFATACAAYKKRTRNGDLHDSFAYESPRADDVKINDANLDEKIKSFLDGLHMASVDPEEVNGTRVDETGESSRRRNST
ncbi:hypothetical protein F5Y00DRAFT_249178 [Daldinia vernicosa]|uniref:uncharacterized protein n=1 Tax=Daldinia vernicosa TaxID=114800 RepID=UPI002008C7FE|nr:uncharacterized protein F5Y00DRAFT_249178 [Daldinia vernicosa]KAI0844225.1 hypothetical protein F5Y00DRAFT_249178 [Daldinia vernicosa]